MKQKSKVILFLSKSDVKEYYVRVVSHNGNIIVTSGDGYVDKRDAVKVADKLLKGFSPAILIDETLTCL